MKKIFFVLLIIGTSIFASNQKKLNFLKLRKEKDSIFYRSAEDMLAVEILIIGLRLDEIRSPIGPKVSIAGLASLALLKAAIPADEVVSTEKGLAVAVLPVTICTVGLAAGANAFGFPSDYSSPAAICSMIYAVFLATAAMKK